MPLTRDAEQQLEDINLIPVGKLICLGRAAYAAYKCFKSAGGDPDKLAKCVETLVAKIEDCMSK
jgi:hypothetical protein